MFKNSTIFYLSLRAFILSCVVVLLITVSTGRAASGEKTDRVLDEVLDLYGDLQGLSVDYQREIITKSMAILEHETVSDIATGRFLFKPPQYLKVEQETPDKEVVTTDGEKVWWYIPAENLVYRYPADKLGKELRLLSGLFKGLNNFSDRFDITLRVREDEKCYELKLTPREYGQEVDHIMVYVDCRDFHIRRIEIHNLVGTVTRFRLGEFSEVDGIKKESFIFTAPEGVEVIKEE